MKVFVVFIGAVFLSIISLVILSHLMSALGVSSWSEGTLLQIGVPLGIGIGLIVNVYSYMRRRKPTTRYRDDDDIIYQRTVRKRRR